MKTIRHGALAATAAGAMLFGSAGNAWAFTKPSDVPDGYVWFQSGVGAPNAAWVETNTFNGAAGWCTTNDKTFVAAAPGRKCYIYNSELYTSSPGGNKVNPSATPVTVTFPGDELRLGQWGSIRSLTLYPHHCHIERMVMTGGSQLYFGGWRPAFTGNLYLEGSTAAKPANFTEMGHQARYTWTHETAMTLHGDADECIKLTRNSGNIDGSWSADYAYTGDMSDYYGSFMTESNVTFAALGVVKGTLDVVKDATYRTWYDHGNYDDQKKVAYMSGNPVVSNLVVHAGGLVEVSASNVLTVANLTLEDGAKIQLNTVGESNGCIVVTGKLTVNGKVQITCNHTFNYATGEPPVYRMIELGPDAEGTLDPNQFEITHGSVSRVAELPHVYAEVRDGKFVLTRREVVSLVLGESSDTNNVSPLITATNTTGKSYWSNGRAPEAGKDYLVNGKFAINIPTKTASEYVKFAGASLTLAPDNNACIQTGNGKRTQGLDIADLRMSNSYFQVWSGSGSYYGMNTFTLTGGTLTLSGANNILKPFGNYLLRIASEVKGAGDLKFSGHEGSGNGGPRGQVEFTNFNTNWTGKLRITMPYGTKTRAKEWGGDTAPNEVLFARLYVQNGRNLGGPLANFTYNALQIDQMSMLHTKGNGGEIVLDQTNRGVYVQGLARFNVEGTDTLTIKNPLRLEGTLRKEGTGTLALGGALSFLDGAAAPVTGTNLVVVKEGAIKALSTNALDGAAITLESGAAFAFDLEPTNDDVAKYGVYDVKANGGITADDTINVALGTGSETLSGDKTLGLFTVATQEAAETLLGKLKFTTKPKASVVETRVVAQEDVYTVQATVKSAGLMIFMR